MAKLKSEPIQTVDLLEYLRSHSDFSFELAILQMLREKGLDCEHGGLYEDPVTGKSREFDIRSHKAISKYCVRLAIECKNIGENFPILISCMPRHEQESYHQVALLGERRTDSSFYVPSLAGSRAKTLDIQGRFSIYKPGEPVGKSTVQVGRSFSDGSISANDSELYEKWGQCLSSAADLVNRAYWDGRNDDVYVDNTLSMVIPMVVVPNFRLWSVLYDDDGRRVSEPAQINRCSCFIGKEYEMGPSRVSAALSLSHVEIVTANGMISFVDDYIKTEQGLERLFSSEGLIEAANR